MIEKMPSPEDRQQEQAMQMMASLIEKIIDDPQMIKELAEPNKNDNN